MRKLLRLTILAGLMVLFGAAEDGIVFGIGSAHWRPAPNLVYAILFATAGGDCCIA